MRHGTRCSKLRAMAAWHPLSRKCARLDWRLKMTVSNGVLSISQIPPKLCKIFSDKNWLGISNKFTQVYMYFETVLCHFTSCMIWPCWSCWSGLKFEDLVSYLFEEGSFGCSTGNNEQQCCWEKEQAAPVEEDAKPADVESLRRKAWTDDGMPMWPVYYT